MIFQKKKKTFFTFSNIMNSNLIISDNTSLMRPPTTHCTERFLNGIIDSIINGFTGLNSTYYSGLSLLHLAVIKKKYCVVEALLNLGIDRTIASTHHSQTAMHIACMNGFFAIIRLMISKGHEDLEICDRHGKTPLNYAIEFGHKPVAKFLIQKGALLFHIPQNIVNELHETRENRVRRLQRMRQQSLIRERFTIGSVQILRRSNTLEPENVEETKIEVVRPNKEIIDLIVNNEINKKSSCPISLEEINKETAVVTNCFHVFSRENIENWLKVKDFCPVCKTKCFVMN